MTTSGMVQTETRKTVTKIVSSSTRSVQQQQQQEESSEVVETMTEENSVQKKDRKSKKVKKGKENNSVVSWVGGTARHFQGAQSIYCCTGIHTGDTVDDQLSEWMRGGGGSV